MLYRNFAYFFFFFNDTATTEIYTLSLHDALPIFEEGLVNEAMLKESLDTLRGQFDPVNGGVSGQQKFPHAGTMEWVMARYHRTREEGLHKIFTRTLTAMANGGVHAQGGGGLHPSATAPPWVAAPLQEMLCEHAR